MVEGWKKLCNLKFCSLEREMDGACSGRGKDDK
jgi:hypothetical protein